MAQPVIGNPLTDTHYREINKALNSLANAYRQIEMAKEAGLDMSEYETTYSILRRKLEDKKRVYFPERP